MLIVTTDNTGGGFFLFFGGGGCLWACEDKLPVNIYVNNGKSSVRVKLIHFVHK